MQTLDPRPLEPRRSGRCRDWIWVPSVYFTQGLPYALVISVSPVLYKRLGLDNTQIAFYTGWLYLPWIIKPLWSPVVELMRSKRWWIVTMQMLMGCGFAAIGLTIPTDGCLPWSLTFFWLLAFSSATHDIAVDGMYMLGLPERSQAFFVGIRSTFYRLAMLAGQGGVVIAAGRLENTLGGVKPAWMLAFLGTSALLFLLSLYHFRTLPRPNEDHPPGIPGGLGMEFRNTFKQFFTQKNIGWILAFILTYRLGESQLVKIAPLFLLDPPAEGGLGLQTSHYGLVYGVVGLIALLGGGILGGMATSRNGLKSWIWVMLVCMNLPNLAYVYLSWLQPESIWIITACVALEQLGYGFGFTGLILLLIHVSKGPYQTAHYAIGTGLWSLGMMLPGMISGWIQSWLGYPVFFFWVMLASLPVFGTAKKIIGVLEEPRQVR